MQILTSNDDIAGNGRIMVYQCLYLPMFIYTNANLFIDVKKKVTLAHLQPSLPLKIFNTSGVERHGCHSKNGSQCEKAYCNLGGPFFITFNVICTLIFRSFR